MADKGVIFSASMVRALLDGRKTQTRRLIKPTGKPAGTGDIVVSWPADSAERQGVTFRPPYAPGDRLYVREHWKTSASLDHVAPRDLPRDCSILLLADNSVPTKAFRPPWGRHRQGMHMPRWASRLWLEVTDVRVQRVAEMTASDAVAEGIARFNPCDVETWRWEPRGPFASWPEGAFQMLWNSLHTKPGERWEDNPFVVAVSFEVHHGNIDQISTEGSAGQPNKRRVNS